jgi:hypothetical protein
MADSEQTKRIGVDTSMSADRRAQLREQLLDATPSWYSPWFHLAAPSLFGLSAIAACAWLLQTTLWWHWLTIPITYLAANIGEWRVHKYWLHKRTKFAPMLYDQHTPMHHMVYVTHDMAMRDRREWRLVLIPPYGIMIIFFGLLLPSAALWYFGQGNIACLFVATLMAYVLGYEWLHLSYHLPVDHPIGRMRLIGRLRHHHAVHHDPTLMQKWNFNVTVPLWDWVMGTIAKQ